MTKEESKEIPLSCKTKHILKTIHYPVGGFLMPGKENTDESNVITADGRQDR